MINAPNTDDAMLQLAAYDAGYRYGTAAGSWVVDGNTSLTPPRGPYCAGSRKVTRPFTIIPSSPLSGEWADDPTPATVLAELGVDENDDRVDDLLRQYEFGFSSAVDSVVIAACRYQLGEDEPTTTTPTYEPSYFCCVDCLMFLANGDLPTELEDDDTAQWLARVLERSAGGRWELGDTEDYGFSWSSCDVCGSPLGGDRYPVVFIPTETDNESETK